MADAKLIHLFGPGGLRCRCCRMAGRYTNSKRAQAGKIRASRKRDKVRAISES